MDLKNAKGLMANFGKLTERQMNQIRHYGAKIMVCKEKREGWSGELPFFIFWCPDCENFSYDYPHGHIERRYLLCHRCGVIIDFRPWWVEWKALLNLLKYHIFPPRK